MSDAPAPVVVSVSSWRLTCGETAVEVSLIFDQYRVSAPGDKHPAAFPGALEPSVVLGYAARYAEATEAAREAADAAVAARGVLLRAADAAYEPAPAVS